MNCAILNDTLIIATQSITLELTRCDHYKNQKDIEHKFSNAFLRNRPAVIQRCRHR